MKKFLCGFISGAILCSAIAVFAVSYVADPAGFKVLVNGSEFTSDPPPVVIEGRTYLPLRAIGDALGVPVNWNEELGQAEVGTTTSVQSAGTLDGKYHVEILSATKTVDYQGKPAVIVNFRYTNNGEETESFWLALTAKAFQNGVQLDNASLLSNPLYDPSAYLKDVKKGGSLIVQRAYLLADESPLEVEVSAALSFDDNPVISKTFQLTD